MVGKYNAQVLLDTGAAISVVPVRWVPKSQHTAETCFIKGVQGDEMPYRVRHAAFNLHGKVFRKCVALSDEMSETEPVLFSVNPNNMDEVELLRNILPTSNVNAVTTRW